MRTERGASRVGFLRAAAAAAVLLLGLSACQTTGIGIIDGTGRTAAGCQTSSEGTITTLALDNDDLFNVYAVFGKKTITLTEGDLTGRATVEIAIATDEPSTPLLYGTVRVTHHDTGEVFLFDVEHGVATLDVNGTRATFIRSADGDYPGGSITVMVADGSVPDDVGDAEHPCDWL